jgi:hypothetical protein
MGTFHMIISVNQDTYNNLHAEYPHVLDRSKALTEHVHNKVLSDDVVYNTGVVTDKTYQLAVIVDETEPYDEVVYTAHAQALAKELTTQYTTSKIYDMFEPTRRVTQGAVHTNVTEVAKRVATIHAKFRLVLQNMLSVVAIITALSMLPNITRADLNKVAIAKHVAYSKLDVWITSVLIVILTVYLVDRLSNLNLKVLRILVGLMAFISILLLIDVIPINLNNILIQVLLVSIKVMQVLLIAMSAVILAQMVWFIIRPGVDAKLLPDTVTLTTKDSTKYYLVTLRKVDDSYAYNATRTYGITVD